MTRLTKKSRLSLTLSLTVWVWVILGCVTTVTVRPDLNRLGPVRDLKSYRTLLGKEFNQKLSMLNADSHVIDIEGIEFAALQLARGDENPGPNVTLVNAFRQKSDANQAGFSLLYGQPFDRFSLGDFLKYHHADLILDLFGDSFKNGSVPERLLRFHRLLKRNGSFWFVEADIQSSIVKAKSGVQVPLSDYLKTNLKGFDWYEHEGSAGRVIELQKSQEPYFLPKLNDLGSIPNSKNSIRLYQER